ncbi:FAD-binding protein [Rathayibacter sp. YIM 133350]|uniref:FAD-binding protein n=1 Tax=Rathayibacter sp. YIM 133350 TaxID=3131992 RepID=UPI003FD22F76
MRSEIGTNWSGNLSYRAQKLVAPTTLDELAAALGSASSVRALGTRHCFNDIADTSGVLISTRSLPSVIEIDGAARRVRVSAGTRYGDLAEQLERRGWALANLASLPHISVGGAVATGTHGSGNTVRSLAGAVAALELMTPDGELLALGRGDRDFAGAVVNLGALGVVTTLDLEIEPSFTVAQTVYEGLDWDAVLADLSAVTGLGYSTSLFTTWRSRDRVDQLWLKQRAPFAAPAEVLGAAPADAPRHPLPGISAENCTQQLGVPGAWLDRLPHFKLGFTPSNGDELQSEYLVPRRHAAAAINALRELSASIAPLVQVTEVRTIAADALWLSMASETDAVALHFTWLPDQAAVEAFLPTLERALEPFEPRPHWGKLFASVDGGERYPRWEDFVRLRERLDPRGVLRNPFLERLGL